MSADDHFLFSAPQWQLYKLRKEDILRLYDAAGLTTRDNDGEDMTKNELVAAIIRAVRLASSLCASLITPSHRLCSQRKNPTTSSPPRTRGRSSPPSSSCTDGNDAGAEESDVFTERHERKRARKLGRSATTHAVLGLGFPNGGLKRSKSMNFQETTRKARFASELKSPHPRALDAR